MDKIHEVERISFVGTVMHLRVDGKDYEVDIGRQSKRLAQATPEQRANFVVIESGYGIHWPDVDEDLSVDGLVGVKHERARPQADGVASEREAEDRNACSSR